MKQFLLYIFVVMLVGCNYPHLSVSKDGEYVVVRRGIYENQDLLIPIKYVEYQYIRTKKEIETEERERVAKRNERLNSPRCAHFIFDGTYNGYNVDVEIHPELDDDNSGMARYHFKNDFYIETAFTWNWRSSVEDFEKVKFKGESYHTKLHADDVVRGNGDEFMDIHTPFCFKDVDFDGKYEILFSAGGYNRNYYEVYKITAPKQATQMSTKPFNNFVLAHIEDENDDSTGIHFDYTKKTITINEPMGATEYYHDIWQQNPKSKNPLNPMVHLRGVHKECGACFTTRVFSKHNEITDVESSYPIDSTWTVFAKYKKRGDDVRLINLELINVQDNKIRHTLQW